MASLQPIHQLERSADDRYQWKATGHDPQFLLAQHLAPGWYEIRFRAQMSAGFAYAKLYWAVDGAFSEAHSTPLAVISDRDEWQTRYVLIRERATALRLDPLDRPAHFDFSGFRLRRVWHPVAVARLARKAVRYLTEQSSARVNGGTLGLLKEVGLSARGFVQSLQGVEAPSEDELYQYLIRATPAANAPVSSSSVCVVITGPESAATEDSLRAQTHRQWSRVTSGQVLPSADYVCLIDAGDVLAPDALQQLAERLDEEPSLDAVYSDEDTLTAAGERSAPFYKPDWSPAYFHATGYASRLAAIRSGLGERIGGFGGGPDEVFARVAVATSRIGHVRRVLYHRGSARRWERKPSPPPSLRSQPLVSIVIPTANTVAKVRGAQLDVVANCVRSIRERSTYRNIEIIVLDEGTLRDDTRAALERFDCVIGTYNKRPFNLARKLNYGARMARGEFVLLLNDDTEVIAPGWIEAMLKHALRDDVGVVGAKLLFEDGSIQHAGVTFGGGLPDHIRRKFPREDTGYFFSTVAARDYMGVTGACMLTPKHLYERLGGYEPSFPINYNDIDYCMKVISDGLRVVYEPDAELYHFESLSRVVTVPTNDISQFFHKWSHLTLDDPFYNGEALDSQPPNFQLKRV